MKKIFVDTIFYWIYSSNEEAFSQMQKDYLTIVKVEIQIFLFLLYLLTPSIICYKRNLPKNILNIYQNIFMILQIFSLLTRISSSQLINLPLRIQKMPFSTLPPKNTISPCSSLAISKTLLQMTSLYSLPNSSQKSWQSNFLPIAAKTS